MLRAEAEARAIAVLPDGCLVLTGFQNFNNNLENVFILKTDAQGNTLWMNNFGTNASRKKGLALAIAQNGDFVVAGEIKDNLPTKDIYVLRVGTSGNLIKEQTYELSDDMGNTGEDEARSIFASSDSRCGL